LVELKKAAEMGKQPKVIEEDSQDYQDVIRAVGVRIREARQKAGLSQAQLGAKASLPQSYIFEIETGGTNITLRTLARLADVLQTSLRDCMPEDTGAILAILSRFDTVISRLEQQIAERQAQEVKRQIQETELISELKTLAGLRPVLEKLVSRNDRESDDSDSKEPRSSKEKDPS
jgi:transcriptional regulator with XRE-family HTH domain